MNVPEILDKAADYIEANGWLQGNFTGPVTRGTRPCACAIGAMIEVCPDLVLVRHDAYDALVSTVGGRPIAVWNDTKGRTEAEVIAAFRAAAEKARSSS
jgi:hypothetical protein